MNRSVQICAALAVACLALSGCHKDPPAPSVIITNENEVLTYPSRKPVAWAELDFEYGTCTHPMHGPPELEVSLVVLFDDEAGIQGLEQIMMRLTGMIRIVHADEGCDVFTYPMFEEIEVEEIETEDEGRDFVVKDMGPPQYFRVNLVKGKIYSDMYKEIGGLKTAYRDYLQTKPEVPTTTICVSRKEKMADLWKVVKQMSDIGCEQIHVGTLKDGVEGFIGN